MFLKNNYVLAILTILLFKRTVGSWEFLPVEDNVVIRTEAQVRFIMTSVIEMFRIECDELLEQYFTIHNNLLAPSLQGADSWKEVLDAAKVNVSGDMIDIVTEVVNEFTNYTDNTNMHIRKDEMIKQINEFLQEVELLNIKYSHDIAVESFLQNKLILKNSSSDELYPDIPEQSLENDTDLNELWTPPKSQENSGRRIFSSRMTTVSRFPFVAAIIIFGQFHCAGTVIANDLVITAASGVQLVYNNRMFKENPAVLAVRIGSTYHNVGGDLIAVLQIDLHPSYDPQTLSNNICLLRLVRHIKFRNKQSRDTRVKKIVFDKNDSVLANNTRDVLILGWGAKSMSNKMSMEGALRYAHLNVYALKDCQEIYSKDYVTRNNFCGGFVSRGGGACNEDVGDPGIINGKLYGIVSFGAPTCGAADSPTVFTKVGFYADWIESIMKQKVPTAYQRILTTEQFVITKETTRQEEAKQKIGQVVDVIMIPRNNKTRTTHTTKDDYKHDIESDTTLDYTARATRRDKVRKKKKVKDTEMTRTTFYDDYAPAKLLDYTYPESIEDYISKKPKKVKFGKNKLKQKQDVQYQYEDEEYQEQSHKHKPVNLHHHSYKNITRENWKEVTTTTKFKKRKRKKYTNSHEKSTPIQFHEPIQNYNKMSKYEKISSEYNVHTNSKDLKYEKLKQIPHNITNSEEYEVLDYDDYDHPDSKLDHKKNKALVSSSIADSKKTTKLSYKNVNKTHSYYYDQNEMQYENQDSYYYDYLPNNETYNDGGEIPNQYDLPKSSKLKDKHEKNHQNDPSKHTKEIKINKDYEDAYELYNEDYGSVERQEYNSEEYYNNLHKQKPTFGPDKKQNAKHKQNPDNKKNSFDAGANKNSELPKVLKNLASHELKLMFLEQLAKQTEDRTKLTKNAKNHISRTKSRKEIAKMKTKTTKPSAKQSQENGFYNLMKSAFDKIKLKLTQVTHPL